MTTARLADAGLAAAWREAAEHGQPALVARATATGPVVVWANRGLADLLGRALHDLPGQAVADLDDPDGGPAAASSWTLAARALAPGAGGTRPGTVRRHDGTTDEVLVTVTPVAPHGGTAEGGTTDGGTEDGTADGSTWLVEVQPADPGPGGLRAALREAEHRFAALAGSAPIGICVSEAGLRLGYVNERFAELMALGHHRVLGTGWLEVVHDDDLELLHEAVTTVLAGAPSEVTLRVVDPAGAAGGVDRGAGRDAEREAGERRWLHLRLAPTTTPTRAAGFIGTAEDVTQRRAWEERITYQAHHDPLTGLVNRRRLTEVLQQLLGSRRSRDREFAVLFLDLDRFKQVNDTFGHDAGDRVLIEVARRLQRTARELDLLARVAGDEFVVVLRGVATVAEAEAAARRHLDALGEPHLLGRQEIALGASVGVALPANHDTPESLLRAADRVMYDAKAAGQGGYRLAPVAPAGPAEEGSRA